MHGGMTEELWLSHADENRPQVELQRRIWDELHATMNPETGDVCVWVEDYVATLTGSVDSDPVRILVGRVTGHVPGVRAVVNELHVVMESSTVLPE